MDETGVITAMTPTYSRKRGERAVDSAPGTCESMTVISALSLGGVRAPLTFPVATDTTAFQTYIDQVLIPSLHKGDVVVLDNIPPHHAPGVARAIEQVGASVMPLPPYSPDYTPIEEMYSKVKEFLRRVATRTVTGLTDAIGEGLKQVTLEDIIGWFKHAGL